MTPTFSAIGLVAADLGRSFDVYRRLGIDLPTTAPEVPHFEVTLPGGLRLMWDTEKSIRSFDPDYEPTTGGASLAFDCGTAGRVDELHSELCSLGCTSTSTPWDAPWGQRYATLEDPDGYPIDLFAALPDPGPSDT